MYQTKHLRNERCPECAKLGRDRHGDNLGVYSDGSCFCWACGYRKSGNAISAVKRPQSDREDTPAVVLPSDVDTYLPAVARQWLGSYALSEHDFIRNRLLWSEQRQLLVFPYFDKYHNLVAWQGRNFEKDSKWPKWFSKGDLKTLYHILPIKETYSGSVVVVEDIVSAIKVGHVCPAMPVFGSQIGLERLKTLSNRFEEVVVWLDPNMKKQMAREAKNALMFGMSSRVIFSDKDPKEHSFDEISTYLTKE